MYLVGQDEGWRVAARLTGNRDSDQNFFCPDLHKLHFNLRGPSFLFAEIWVVTNFNSNLSPSFGCTMTSDAVNGASPPYEDGKDPMAGMTPSEAHYFNR